MNKLSYDKLLRWICIKYREIKWRLLSKCCTHLMLRCPQGLFKVATSDAQGIGKQLYCYRDFDSDFVRSVFQWLGKKENLTLLDIGANIGPICIGAITAGYAQRALAIEPAPENYALLQENVLLNKLKDSIQLFQAAASNKSEILEIALSNQNHGDHRVLARNSQASESDNSNEGRKRINIKAETIDNIIFKSNPAFLPIHIVWVDVQGFELNVLQGARGLLSTQVPWVVEIWPMGLKRNGVSCQNLLDILSIYFSYYWIYRRGKLACYPINSFEYLFNEIGDDGYFENVIFSC